MRDVLLDWEVDDPNWLEVRRVGGPTSPPPSEDEQAERAAEYMRPLRRFQLRAGQGHDVRAGPAASTWRTRLTRVGPLRSQVYVGGHFRLEDDEAFVVDINDGGGPGTSPCPISNVWGTTLDIKDRDRQPQQGPVRAQCRRNVDLRDLQLTPECHNWVDPCGLSGGHPHPAGWPSSAEQRPADGLAASGRVVKAGRTSESELPNGTSVVNATSERRPAHSPRRAATYPADCPRSRREPRWLVTGCSTENRTGDRHAALDAGHSVAVTARRPETVQDLADQYPEQRPRPYAST